MANVTPEDVAEIIDKFEESDENKQGGVMGIEGYFPHISTYSFTALVSFPWFFILFFTLGSTIN